MLALSLADIQSAAKQIEGVAVRTPLLNFPALDSQVGGRVFLKPECLQQKGAFKFRGAYNFISRLSDSERAGGVVACSSGNHAQGVAEAARLCGVTAAIVMPEDSPKVKVEGTRASGAEVIFYDRYTEDREAIARSICKERGAVFIHPFNEPIIMAGQGTIGLEIADDLKALGLSPDVALVPLSGGGLASGVSLGLHGDFPSARFGVASPKDMTMSGYLWPLASSLKLRQILMRALFATRSWRRWLVPTIFRSFKSILLAVTWFLTMQPCVRLAMPYAICTCL